jgi:hypothetical protein
MNLERMLPRADKARFCQPRDLATGITFTLLGAAEANGQRRPRGHNPPINCHGSDRGEGKVDQGSASHDAHRCSDFVVQCDFNFSARAEAVIAACASPVKVAPFQARRTIRNAGRTTMAIMAQAAFAAWCSVTPRSRKLRRQTQVARRLFSVKKAPDRMDVFVAKCLAWSARSLRP